MWLIVGLGNPGPEYAATRHNIGFMAVDRLANGSGFTTSKFQAESVKTKIQGEDALLLKPMTFMNLSGKSVQAAAAFYKIAPEKIIVLHDEVDLPLAKMRIKKGGGANGHNGIKDIDAKIGPDYWRIRLGVGRPEFGDTADYVLGRFSKEEEAPLDTFLKVLTENFHYFMEHSPEKLASKVAETLNPPQPKKPKEEKKEETTDGL